MLAKVAKKSSIYDVTHKKPAPPTKNFFLSANYKMRLSILQPGP